MVGSEFRPWLLRTTSSWVLKSSQNRECTTTLGKPRHCLRVRKFLLVQGWNISSFSLWPLLLLPCTTEEPLGDPHMHLGRQVVGPLRGHLFPGLHLFTPAPLPQPLFLWQEHQPPSISRPCAQLAPFYQHLFCVEGAQNWAQYLDVARWMARKVG